MTVTPDSHGMAWLGAYMSGVDAARIYARLTAIAKGIDDPERGIDATRCDLLIDALLTSRPATTTATEAGAGDAEVEAEAGLRLAPPARRRGGGRRRRCGRGL